MLKGFYLKICVTDGSGNASAVVAAAEFVFSVFDVAGSVAVAAVTAPVSADSPTMLPMSLFSLGLVCCLDLRG